MTGAWWSGLETLVGPSVTGVEFEVKGLEAWFCNVVFEVLARIRKTTDVQNIGLLQPPFEPKFFPRYPPHYAMLSTLRTLTLRGYMNRPGWIMLFRDVRASRRSICSRPTKSTTTTTSWRTAGSCFHPSEGSASITKFTRTSSPPFWFVQPCRRLWNSTYLWQNGWVWTWP